jgi:D-alanyl-D-alanine carboxypeptidase (penicillin-binding protein 5/6)
MFACIVITGLFAGASLLIGGNSLSGIRSGSYTNEEDKDTVTGVDTSENNSGDVSDTTIANIVTPASTQNPEDLSASNAGEAQNVTSTEPWLTSNPTDLGAGLSEEENGLAATQAPTGNTSDNGAEQETPQSTTTASLGLEEAPKLIYNCNEIDYKAYIPEMIVDNELEAAMDIDNPDISVDAEAAILFDATTMKVLYYKNAVQAMFPASTAKLLSSLVILKYCEDTEEVTIGDEITMIAPDSTTAGLNQGQVLTIRNLMTGMLLPSGNDAAYAAAAYVGRKSLDNPDASKEKAVAEFVRLMNEEAANLGVKNSCFKTPDGYDAIGQYTTAYDMGLIGIAASQNSVIKDIAQESSSRNVFISGEDVSWSNTNKLITRYSGQYYSKAIGLKTGTSSMAGRCLIAAAESNGKKVVSVILDSTIEGRWEDAIALLKYGLE